MPRADIIPSDLRYIRQALTWWNHSGPRSDDDMYPLHLTVRQAKWLLELVEEAARGDLAQ